MAMSEIDYWQGFRDALEIALRELDAKRPERIEDLRRSTSLKLQKLRDDINRSESR